MILQNYANGLSANATVTYIPSISGVCRLRLTIVTTLPFPFLRVSKVEAKIEITRNLETTESFYQNGCYYDGVKKQVGLFNMVEVLHYGVLVWALIRRSRHQRRTSGQVRYWNAIVRRRKWLSHSVPSIFLHAAQ